ncbi:MAG: D-alanyl-D-alanine carboxypeptidase family protein [Oscillospiraceae bacterium]|nr:D-alanyl-D-alanine carboxypeptidase family protein [Oscillospiraceae bacterium]
MNNNQNQNRNSNQRDIRNINNISRNQNIRQNHNRNKSKSGNYVNHLSRQRQLRQQRRKRTSFFVKYGLRLLMFLFFFVLISGICLALFFFNLTNIKKPQDIIYTITTSQVKNSKPQNIPLAYDVGFANGQYYFPINGIMETMGFGLAGDGNEFSFFKDKSGEYIKFIADTNIAYINDEKCHLPGPSFADDIKNIYVPLEFLENTFNNLQFSFDEKDKNKIKIDILDIGESCFIIQKAKKIESANESDAPYFSSDPVNFLADLSEYEKYFNPPGDTAKEYIILINPANPLEPQDYVPPDLTDVSDTRQDGRDIQKLRLYPAKALEAFLIESRANGFANISVTSAYRSYAFQSQLFNAEAERQRPVHGDNAEAVAATAVARPGQSEHQSGLCADMHSYTAANQNFGDTPEGQWLAENAHYFGFILRYPKDKTEITGIMYEPWHFRYVGRYHATKIYELGLCFEEYWEQYLGK